MGVRVSAPVVKGRLAELNMRRETLASRLNVAYTSVCKLLKGGPVSLEFAVGVSRELDLPLGDLSPEAARLLSGVEAHVSTP